jgi:hypothetical protein
MTYKINKTDGTLLAEVIDSAIDQTATDITLIGKNVAGYGEYINENFVKILENFANTSQPNNPIIGQVWFDTAENRLKVYDGTGFKNGSGPVVRGTQPLDLVQGDIWIDSAENQLYFYDGTDLQLAGPIYKNTQGISGFTVENIFDTNSVSRVIVKLWVAQTLLGIFSKESVPFTPRDAVAGYTGEIKPGFNAGTLSGIKFNVTASAADTLIDPTGTAKTTESFMSSEENTSTVGTVTIQNELPLILGANQNNEVRVSTESMQVVSNISGQDYLFKVKNSSGLVDALTIKSINQRVGIFNVSPEYTLDVGGDVRITGDLTVEGTHTTISTTQMTIEDKNIILANVEAPTDITAEGAGITIKGGSDKTIAWSDHTTYTSFDVSENVNLAAGKSFYIGGNQILSETTLASSVTSAPGLTSFGPQNNITVDNLYLDGNTISSTDTNGNIVLDPDGTGTVDLSSARISNLADPTDDQDASTKLYTETFVKRRTIPLSLDITGLSDADIALVLEDIAPAAEYYDSSTDQGTEALVHCTEQVITYPSVSLTNSTSPDVSGDFVKHYVSVNKAAGTENQPVLEDFDINTLDFGNATVTVQRSLKRFRITSGVWGWVENLTSSV